MLVPFFALAAMLASAIPETAAAQEGNIGLTISLNAGVMEVDLSGVDVTQTWAVRVDAPVTKVWRAEAGVEWAETYQQYDTVAVVVPEVQVQGQYVLGSFAPYAGIGAGVFIQNPQDEDFDTDVDVAANASLGVRAQLIRGFGARAEGRVRGIGQRFGSSTASLSLGLSYTF